MGVVVFNGISSSAYDIQIELIPDYEIPERDYDLIHVPGRNGDIVIDKRHSYKNVTRTYHIASVNLKKDFARIGREISDWLTSPSGYARLEDSYDPEIYRMAVCRGAAEIKNIFNHAGRVDAVFDCMPQKFLKSGERSVVFNASGTLHNDTKFDAKPLVYVYGTGAGVVNVGNSKCEIKSISNRVILDSERMNAYDIDSSGVISNRNSTVYIPEYPILTPGKNDISFSGGITRLEIVPRWWVK